MKLILSAFLTILCTSSLNAQWNIDLKRESYFPSSAKMGVPFPMTFSITNSGTKDIESIDIEYTPSGGSPMTINHNLDIPIQPDSTANVIVNGFICDVIGEEVFGYFTPTHINNEPNYGSGTWLYLFCADELIQRRLVIEEGASIKCGYCPLGYISMEYMREKFTDDTYIGISIHETGEMATPGTFSSFWNRVTGKPTAFANRDFDNTLSPLPGIFEDIHSNITSQAAVVDVTASIQYDKTKNTAIVESNLRFVFDYPESDFRIAYIITEDNLGPYNQRNYYSGGSLGECFGWENKTSYVSIVFNDIAREGSVYDGVEGLIPSEIKAGQIYTPQYELDLSHVNVPENSKVAVLVINGITGKIANAVQIPVTGHTSGIDGMDADATGNTTIATGGIGCIYITSTLPTDIYGIDGRMIIKGTTQGIINASKGIYIARTAKATSKIIVK